MLLLFLNSIRLRLGVLRPQKLLIKISELRLIAGISHIFTPCAQADREIPQPQDGVGVGVEAEADVKTEGGTAAEVEGVRSGAELIAHYGCIFSGLVGAVSYLYIAHLPNKPSSIMKCSRVRSELEAGFNSIITAGFLRLQLRFPLSISLHFQLRFE